MFFASCKEKEIGVTESELITIQQAFNCANHDWDFTVYGIKIVLSPITQVEMLHKRVKSLEERVSYLENKK